MQRTMSPSIVAPNDTNSYTLGQIGHHNVVIACLPNGEYGIGPAATVAKTCCFPNIRIGLMVGIGGGVPSEEHDIHLGDVVVSSSHNGKASVFQYDFGKAVQNGGFRHTGYMNLPPRAARSAIGKLGSQYEVHGHRLEEAIDTILAMYPRLRAKYQRRDPSRDILHVPEVVHGKCCCHMVCEEGKENLVD